MSDFAGATISTLRDREEIEVRRALDTELSIAIEMKRREMIERQPDLVQVQPNHLAFASAFPLRQFIYEAFPILEPGREYKNNWHIDCIAETLEAGTTGQLRKIVINIPRRCMKSLMFSVFWFCWSWTFVPWTRWLYASFSEKFAYRDSNQCRRLLLSTYYQSRFNDVWKQSLEDWRTARFANDKGGFRACFGVTKGTGDGGDFVMVDDPHQIDEAESEKQITKTINWYFETYYNNVTDPQKAVRAIIHQRIGEDDLTGAILARELDYEHLCLPMHFEDDHPHKNSVSKPFKLGTVTAFEKNLNPELEVGDEKLWVDPRDDEAPNFDNRWYKSWYKRSFKSLGLESTGENALLWPHRFSEADVKDQVDHLQAYGESAQLQQRPIRRGGNFFALKNFTSNIVSLGSVDLNNLTYVRYWDKAGTEAAGDWTVGMLMARTSKRPYTLYLINIFRDQISLYARMAKMKELAEADTKDYIESALYTSYTIGIEKEGASAGKDLATLERDHLLGYHVIIDRPRGKKAHRANTVKSISEAGRLKVIRGPWNDVFFREIQRFRPDKEHQVDDQVDALSGATKLLIFGQPNDDGGSESGVY